MDWIVAYGIRWYERRSGYFSNSRHGLLHRYVYEQEIGPIAEGAHVHHRDENKANNAPANLVALSPDEHFREHPRDADWHAAGGRATWRNRPLLARECEECDRPFTSRARHVRFCSTICGQRHYERTRTGRSYEGRVCEVCGHDFQARTASATLTCSRSCTAKLAYRSRRSAL